MLAWILPTVLNVLVPPTSGHGRIQPKMDLANALMPFFHFVVTFCSGIGILAILAGGVGVIFSFFAQAVDGPSFADQRLRSQFLKAVADGRLTTVHPEIIAGATQWARDNDFQITTGSATDANLARTIHETEAEDRLAVLQDLIERHIAVLTKGYATGTISLADWVSLDKATKLFEQLSRISLGDHGPRHIQEIVALYPAIIQMLAPDVELLGMEEVSAADKAEIRRDLRRWGAWMAETEKALMDEHPTEEAIRRELAHDLVTQVRALTLTAE